MPTRNCRLDNDPIHDFNQATHILIRSKNRLFCTNGPFYQPAMACWPAGLLESVPAER